jgi:Glycosyltransferase like family 2
MLTESTRTTRSPVRRGLSPARWIVSGVATFEMGLALSSGYLLTLLLAAFREAKSSDVETSAPSAPHKFVVLVPAHNEQDGIRATLQSLHNCSYPASAKRVVVIADNCSDETARCAKEAMVEVWERTDDAKRGKGFALSWGLGRLSAEGQDCDAIVMLDADCLASPNMLAAIDHRLRLGANAVQVNYLAGNPEASSAAAIRFAGLALMNTVRFMGKQRLGLSCGLVGSGMAFTSKLLAREPWTATGLTEDGEYHMRLVMAGERVSFAPEAWISSPMPTRRGSTSEERWEQGKLQLIRRWSPQLLRAGLARRDVAQLHAGLECLVPPQSLIAVGSVVSASVGACLGSRRLVWLSTLTIVAQFFFVLAGLRLVRAPSHVYRALLTAPALMAGKVALYARLVQGRGPKTWVRAEREASS